MRVTPEFSLESSWTRRSFVRAGALALGGGGLSLADVFRLQAESRWEPDWEEFEQAVQPQTKLVYISNETPRLKLKYGLLVKQHSLTKEAYRYWELLKSQLDNPGSLYETQPSNAQGNIYNIKLYA